MNAPLKALIGTLNSSARRRDGRWWNQEQLKCANEAVMAEVERMKPELRRRREQDQRKISDIQFDRDRDLDERGISAGDAWADENPLQSSGTSRRF